MTSPVRTTSGLEAWRHTGGMSMPRPAATPRDRTPLALEFPQSLAVYDDYADAQRAVDFLSDHEFPVENLMIVGTDLKQVERITGRLTTGRIALAGTASGMWLGLFVGLLLSLFGTGSATATVLSTVLMGAVFGLVWSLIGYAATRGRRDFSAVSAVVATRYEVLVEHKLLARAQELLAQAPGLRRDPFA
jgi:hypothetical protein